MHRSLRLLAAVSLAIPSGIAAQQWTLLNPPTTPAATIAPGMAYDVQHDRTVLFGGQAQLTGWPIQFFNDTWLFDGTTWSNANPTVRPPARSKHGMVADDNGQVLLFGGIDANGTPLNDLWRWDGSNWTHLSTDFAVQPRSLPAMASYGSGCLIFGGYNDLTQTYLGDTWLWSPGSGWNEWTTSPAPSARRDAGMLEVNNLNIVLHGGHNLGPLDDTWRWDNGDWTQLVQAGGPTRSSFAMGYDPASRQVFLSGGHDANTGTGFTDDLWRFDGAVWRDITPTTMPTQAVLRASTLDTTRHRLMTFGGTSGNNASNEHWEFDSTYPVTKFGTSCATSGPVPRLETNAAKLGSTFRMTIYGNGGNVPFGVFAIGFSNQSWNGVSLPLSLASLGLNCDLLVEPFTMKIANGGTVSSLIGSFLGIPDMPVLAGIELFVQGAVLDNTGMRAVTEAARCRIF